VFEARPGGGTDGVERSTSATRNPDHRLIRDQRDGDEHSAEHAADDAAHQQSPGMNTGAGDGDQREKGWSEMMGWKPI